jgi:hypothetical protein
MTALDCIIFMGEWFAIAPSPQNSKCTVILHRAFVVCTFLYSRIIDEGLLARVSKVMYCTTKLVMMEKP